MNSHSETMEVAELLVAHDIWPNHIWALKKKRIPCLLVDATMKKNSPRKLPVIKSFHKYLYEDFSKTLTVSEEDAKGFRSFKCRNVQIKVVDDTRFDRVYSRSLASKKSRIINTNVIEGKKVLVAGSTWQQDEDVIIPSFQKLLKFEKNALIIIAPHEPTLMHLEKLEQEFSGEVSFIRLSDINNYNNQSVIIVDSLECYLFFTASRHRRRFLADGRNLARDALRQVVAGRRGHCPSP